MVREIVKDEAFLSQKSQPATEADLHIAEDLIDTLKANHKGKRTTYRFETIQVKYKDMQFKSQIRNFSGFTAEIIQHEIDHCEGKII